MVRKIIPPIAMPPYFESYQILAVAQYFANPTLPTVLFNFIAVQKSEHIHQIETTVIHNILLCIYVFFVVLYAFFVHDNRNIFL